MQFKRFFASALLLLVCGGVVKAADLSGDLSLTGRNVTQNGADLSVSTLIAPLRF